MQSIISELQILLSMAVIPQFVIGFKTVRVVLSDGSPVIGKVTQAHQHKEVVEYWGIPFAEPPVKNLRFRKPVRKKPWVEDFEAFHLPKACVQSSDLYFDSFRGSSMWNANTNISEDCLTLTIWAPHNRHQRQVNLAVMVWIYGGGFWSGSSALDVYNGKFLAAEEDVIVVSVNYRVTAFGFLYMGNEDAPGNMGLFDQLEALKWIRDHISHFGGSPNDVTLFAESAGAASVSMHMISPLSTPYFHRAILQSGSVTSPWALESNITLINRLIRLAEACRCNVSIMDKSPDLKKAIECLRRVPAETILQYEWITNEFCDFPWTPVVDGEFLVGNPIQTLESKTFKPMPSLLGSVRDEAMYFIVYHLTDIFRKELFFTETDFVKSDEIFREAARLLLPKHLSRNPVVFDAIVQEYSEFHIPNSAYRRQNALDKMLGDYHFTCNVNEFADYMQRAGGNVYMYHFLHQSSILDWPKWMGVLHGYEIEFEFGLPLDDERGYTKEEQEFSRRMMRYWSNFARTGDPNKNPDGTLVDTVHWPLYTSNSEAYIALEAGVTHPRIGNGIRRRQCAFWKKYLPKLFTATKDITEMEVRWKQEFDKWENQYILDWKYQLERYARLQDRAFADTSCRSGRR